MTHNKATSDGSGKITHFLFLQQVNGRRMESFRKCVTVLMVPRRTQQLVCLRLKGIGSCSLPFLMAILQHNCNVSLSNHSSFVVLRDIYFEEVQSLETKQEIENVLSLETKLLQ